MLTRSSVSVSIISVSAEGRLGDSKVGLDGKGRAVKEGGNTDAWA